MIKTLKNQTEWFRTVEAQSWYYDNAESGHVRIISQFKKN